jgi:tetratricopeptide (TPR) repeat protein
LKVFPLRRRALPGFVFSLTALFCVVVPPAHMRAQQRTDTLLNHSPKIICLASGDWFSLTLSSEQGRAAEILIQTSAPGAEFAVLSPGGDQLKRIYAEQPKWLALSFRLNERGQYRLMAHAPPSKDDYGGISVRIVFLSFPVAYAADRASAEALFNEAQALAGSPSAAPVREAISRYRQASGKWELATCREGQVLALVGEAQSWLELSEYDAALTALDRAYPLSLGIPILRAWLADRLAEVHLDRMDSELARKYADEALALSRTSRDDWLTADSLADRAEAEFYLTQVPSEREDIEQAIKLSRQTHDIAALARALRCSAWIEEVEGHLTRAMSLLDQAELLFQKLGDSRAANIGMSDLAASHAMSGDRYMAILDHARLVPLIRDSGNLTNYAFLLGNIASDYAELNRTHDAIVYYEHSLEIFQKIHHPSGEAIELKELCTNRMREGSLQQALEDCGKSLAIVQRLRDPKRIAIVTLELGRVQRALGQPVRAIASFQSAYNLSAGVNDAWAEARSLIDWGETLEGLGRQEAARRNFEKALLLSREAEDMPAQMEARYFIARSDFESGQTEDAKHELRVVLGQVEIQRSAVGNADLQASYFAQMRKCHDLYVEVLMHEQERDHPSTEVAAQALEVSESGRARALLDALAARDGDPALRRQASASGELMALHVAVERAYDERLKLMLEGSRKRELDVNEAALTQAIDTLGRAEDEQKAVAESSTPLRRTLSASEIGAAGQNLQSTLIEYALGSEHSYVWVVDNGRIESYVLPPRNHIESAVRKWRLLATARMPLPGESFDGHRKRVETADRKIPQVGANLSCMLFGPFLLPRMKQLTIVPDGELYLLPFAALPEDGCKGGKQEPLAAERQVVFTPSLSVLLARHGPSRQAASRGDVVLLADPVFDRDDPRLHVSKDSKADNSFSNLRPTPPRLIGTRDEAEAIAAIAGPQRSALHLDFNASRETFFDPSLSEYRILHLATHGVFDERRPDFSGIILSLVGRDGRPAFGYLNTHDLAGLNLPFDLVVLSACDSGAGVNLSGEGVTGLNHAFLSAGARRVVSTLWSVDDEISKELMTTFYRGMLRDGLNPSEALRRSQVKMMRNSRTMAPYYWAGFVATSTTL